MAQEQAQETPAPAPGSPAHLLQEALPGVRMTFERTALDDALTVRREDLARVMRAAKEDDRLAFDFLRSLSGVDHLDELEVVYHLYSYRLAHALAVKVRCPPDDAHLPTVGDLWQTANWHEREAAELFGFVFDGHPDLRPLLTEEGLGYYPLRKTHPLAEIEAWQEDYLEAAEEAVAQAAAAAGVPMDERALKIQAAQKKAAVIKKAREEARAKGLSGDEEKAAVQAALKAFEEEEAAAAETGPAAPAAPVDDRAAKIALAQKKAAVIKKAREEARAKGLTGDEEKAAVQAALKALEGEPAAAAAAPSAAPKPADDRAAKIALAQKKAALIKKTREEARARGASPEEERQAVAEALKELAAEEKGG